MTHQCLSCGITIEVADGDAFPRSDERCSHEWEPAQPAATAEHDLARLIRDLDFYLTPGDAPVLDGFLAKAFARRMARAGTPQAPGPDAAAIEAACREVDREFDA